jgi:hypothetical protein
MNGHRTSGPTSARAAQAAPTRPDLRWASGGTCWSVGIVIAAAAAGTFFKITGSLPQNVNWAVKSAYGTPLFEQPSRPPQVPEDRAGRINRAIKATCMVIAEKEGG